MFYILARKHDIFCEKKFTEEMLGKFLLLVWADVHHPIFKVEDNIKAGK